MTRINDNFQRLPNRYLFSEIAGRVKQYQQANPKRTLIKLGIGDTTQPLSPAIIQTLHTAVDEMGQLDTYRGYGPEQGYLFLRQAIVDHEYLPLGANIHVDEIFISDGSKCDTGNILDIFGPNRIAMSDPSYPVYIDTNVMQGNAQILMESNQYQEIEYLPCIKENGYIPQPPATDVDLIYLCSPNNPTGVAMTHQDLEKWVKYAQTHHAIILFDAAYERYITDPAIPHSIYEIPGARAVAIEFRSFSKTAGFTGTRCAYTVIPKDLLGFDQEGNPVKVWDLWNRRQSTKFNGVSYIIQRAAEAIYTPAGKAETSAIIGNYLKNAKIIREGLTEAGFEFQGGINSPYIWVRCPGNMGSWEMFDYLLHNLNIVVTPGAGFGPAGEGYFRITAFGDATATRQAVAKIKAHQWIHF